MKIAYLVNQYPSISHSFIRREIQALERRGIEVTRVSIRDMQGTLVDPADQAEHEKTTAVLAAGIIPLLLATFYVFLRAPRRAFSAMQVSIQCGRRARDSMRHLIYFAEAAWLAQQSSRHGFCHIHAHFGTNSTTVAMLCAAIIRNGTFSFTVHGPEEFDRPEAISLSEKIKRSAFVVAVSSFGKSQLQRWCPLSEWDKIHVVHCGLEDEFFNNAEPVAASTQLVCLGRLCEQKGQLLLMRAAEDLRDRGIIFSLVLVGDGPMRKDVEEYVRGSKLESVVTVTGWQNQSQVTRWLLTSRCMILPSFAEGLPVAIMEALALKRPVISTYIAGIPELITPECGWLTPAGDVQKLGDAIAACLEADITTLRTMASAGAARVKDQHSISREAEKLAHLFERTTA